MVVQVLVPLIKYVPIPLPAEIDSVVIQMPDGFTSIFQIIHRLSMHSVTISGGCQSLIGGVPKNLIDTGGCTFFGSRKMVHAPILGGSHLEGGGSLQHACSTGGVQKSWD